MQKLSKEIIKFSYKKTTRRPKRLENNVFIIYSPETIKLEPGDHKLINMKIKIFLPKGIEGSCRLLNLFSNERLILMNSNNISQELNSNIQNGHYYDLDNLPPWNLNFELYNSNFTKQSRLKRKKNWDTFTYLMTEGKNYTSNTKKKTIKYYLLKYYLIYTNLQNIYVSIEKSSFVHFLFHYYHYFR